MCRHALPKQCGYRKCTGCLLSPAAKLAAWPRVCLSQMAMACRQPYGVYVRQIADTPSALRLQAQGGVARTCFE